MLIKVGGGGDHPMWIIPPFYKIIIGSINREGGGRKVLIQKMWIKQYVFLPFPEEKEEEDLQDFIILTTSKDRFAH